MSKRIKLLISPSGIDDGVSFQIYRHLVSPVPEDILLIDAEERLLEKRPLPIVGEVLAQETDAPLYFIAERPFMQVPAPQVYIDGVPVPQVDVVLYPKERKIKINNQQIEPNTLQVITMDYHFLAGVVIDDPTKSQFGVQHFGDEIITGMNPPSDLNYFFNAATGELKMTVIRDRTPHERWYRVRLKDNLTGEVSEPTDDQLISLSADDYDVTFSIQVSKDNKATWTDIGSFTGTEFTTAITDDITTKGHSPLDVLPTRTVDGVSITLDIQNPWHQWENNLRATNDYRVRAEDSDGQTTEWAGFAPGGVNYKPTVVRLRRKEHNGSPALYDGLDAMTLTDIVEAGVDISQPRISFTDDHLVPGRTYSYTFYIDDEKGIRSEPFYVVVP